MSPTIHDFSRSFYLIKHILNINYVEYFDVELKLLPYDTDLKNIQHVNFSVTHELINQNDSIRYSIICFYNNVNEPYYTINCNRIRDGYVYHNIISFTESELEYGMIEFMNEMNNTHKIISQIAKPVSVPVSKLLQSRL